MTLSSRTGGGRQLLPCRGLYPPGQVKKSAVNETASQSYEVSLAVWYGIVPPDTNEHTRLNPSQRPVYLNYLLRMDGRLSLPRLPVTYRGGLPAHRRSPIPVLYTKPEQHYTGSLTRNLLITSPMP